MNYDTVEVVIDRLLRTFKLQEWQYDVDALVEDIAEALKLIGAQKIFAEVTVELPVVSKLVKLPPDCQHIMDVLPHTVKYKEQGTFITIDLPDNSLVTLQYQAMPIDSRGYPLVPDDASVRAAIMWYMVVILILQGEIKTVNYSLAESEWQWRCSSARAALNSLSLAQVNTMYQNFVRLNPLKNEYETNFVQMNNINTLDRDKFK